MYKRNRSIDAQWKKLENFSLIINFTLFLNFFNLNSCRSLRNHGQYSIQKIRVVFDHLNLVLYNPRNDPNPEVIPIFLLVDPEMIPKDLGNGD